MVKSFCETKNNDNNYRSVSEYEFYRYEQYHQNIKNSNINYVQAIFMIKRIKTCCSVRLKTDLAVNKRVTFDQTVLQIFTRNYFGKEGDNILSEIRTLNSVDETLDVLKQDFVATLFTSTNDF